MGGEEKKKKEKKGKKTEQVSECFLYAACDARQ